jgi:hypothetical protein
MYPPLILYELAQARIRDDRARVDLRRSARASLRRPRGWRAAISRHLPGLRLDATYRCSRPTTTDDPASARWGAPEPRDHFGEDPSTSEPATTGC